MTRRSVAAAVVAGAVLLGGGGIAWASTGSSGNYRLTTAVVADVESTLSLSGTVASSSRRDLSFGVAGTIEKLAVAVGDTVTSGQTLATLDPDDLDAAVIRATADLARAKAQLETDQAAQATTVAAAIATTASAPTATATAASFTRTASSTVTASADPSSALTKALAMLEEQQAAVTTAQSAASEAIAGAKAALEAQSAACVISEDSGAETAAGPESGDEESGDEESGDDTPAEDDAGPSPISSACTDALAAVQAAQDQVADRQDTLQAALTELVGTLTDAIETLSNQAEEPSEPSAPSTPSEGGASSAPSGGGSASSQAPSEDSSGAQSGGQSGGQSSGGTGGSSAGDVASDQAAIDTAAAALTEAELARDSAALTAPFAGTVLDVQAATGDDVGASDVVVIIVGDGGSTVTTTVTVDQVRDLEKGQVAHVTPAGADAPVDGSVTEIGMLPTTGDSVTYPVTIDLDDDVSAPEGAGATIELVTSTIADAVTVPSSAVANAGRTTVTVLEDGVATRTPVTVGVVGSTRTSITEGIEAGQEVVLANLDAELPSGDAETGTTGFGAGNDRPAGGGAAPGRAQGGRGQ